jgi:hypothetical protein
MKLKLLWSRIFQICCLEIAETQCVHIWSRIVPANYILQFHNLAKPFTEVPC